MSRAQPQLQDAPGDLLVKKKGGAGSKSQGQIQRSNGQVGRGPPPEMKDRLSMADLSLE